MSAPDTGRLAAVGLGASGERLYTALLVHNDATLAELSRAVDLPEEHARELLDSLQEMGLISRSASQPPRYLAADPQPAIELLILRRQEELGRSRLAVDELKERYRLGSQRRRPGEVVEVISGEQACVQRMDQAIRSAEREVLGFGKAPQWAPPPDFVELKLQQLSRGVQSRGVYERAALDSSFMDFLEMLAAKGEQSRVVDHLPMRLLIIDGRLAFTPLQVDRWDEWLLLHQSPLLGALTMVFETVWETAEALPFEAGRAQARSRVPQLTEDDRRILMRLAAGMHDDVIAHQLGIAPRTVLRRVTKIMSLVKASTRFQAGWLAHQRLADAPGRPVGDGAPPQGVRGIRHAPRR